MYFDELETITFTKGKFINFSRDDVVEKVWLENYEQGIAHEIGELKYNSLAEYITNRCEKFADNTSFVNMGASITYKELNEYSDQFGLYLRHELGLQKGDRIAIMMPNLLQYPVALFGAIKAGLIVVNLNPLYTESELRLRLSDSETKNIVVLANFMDKVEGVRSDTPIDNVIVAHIGDMLGGVKGGLINFILKYVKKMVPSFDKTRVTPFPDIFALGKKHAGKDFPEITPEDILFLQYTGGTTGPAKAAVLTNRNILSNAAQASEWVKHFIEEGKETIVTPLPMYHIFSLTMNVIIFSGFGAKNIIITNPRDIPKFIKTIKDSQFTIMSGVNTLFNALMHNKEFKNVDFSKVKLVLGGGMAVQRSVAEKWQEITKKPLLEAYGLTETSPAVTINPCTATGFTGSIGFPLPSTEIKILDDDDNELGFNERGELCVKGPQVTPEYWRSPEETEEKIVDGWLKTGDIAVVDEKGFVTIVDRKKDMINVSGFKVFPNEVEEVIASLPGVMEVGVIGENVNEAQEVVIAYVVKKDNDLLEATVKDHVKKELTTYKHPKRYYFIEELPKTNVGKISRKDLREYHEAHNKVS